MNYGYAKKGFKIQLLDEDEKERYPIQLYHHITNQIEVTNLDVLEIGSGRGGGASYVHRYFKTKSLVGLDISARAVELCNERYGEPGLSFVVGDSENPPFTEKTFDVVLNVESSHCYGNIECFLSGVLRLLKEDGFFLWSDFRSHQEMKDLFDLFLSVGFKIVKEEDITRNILLSLERLSPERERHINKQVPLPFRRLFKSYAGIKGGGMYEAFDSGLLVYKCATLKKII